MEVTYSYEFGELLYQQGIITTKTSTSYTENGFNNIRKAPLWLVRTGRIYTGIRDNMAEGGYYWSSTVVDRDNAYRSYLISSRILSYNNIDKLYGWSIRCLARTED